LSDKVPADFRGAPFVQILRDLNLEKSRAENRIWFRWEVIGERVTSHEATLDGYAARLVWEFPQLRQDRQLITIRRAVTAVVNEAGFKFYHGKDEG